jgi:hypothetical protein
LVGRERRIWYLSVVWAGETMVPSRVLCENKKWGVLSLQNLAGGWYELSRAICPQPHVTPIQKLLG